MPVGAYGGRRDIMESLAPSGPVYQAGTLSGNPVAMAAGLATLRAINSNSEFYADLEKRSALLEKGILESIKKSGIKGVINRVGSMFTLFFTNAKEVKSYSDVVECDTQLFARYFNLLLGEGVYMAPSQFEACFVSQAHTEGDIRYTIDKSLEVFNRIQTEKK